MSLADFGCSKSHDDWRFLIMNQLKSGSCAVPQIQSFGKEIWNGSYARPLRVAREEYTFAHSFYSLITRKEYIHSQFGVADVSPVEVLKSSENMLIEKTIRYISVLYSAINSPSNLFSSSKTYWLYELKEVIGVLWQVGRNQLTSSEKEVMLACFILLGEKFDDRHFINDYYYNLAAVKLFNDICLDKSTPLPTLLLACARMTHVQNRVTSETRNSCKLKVVDMLQLIYKDQAEIKQLHGDWKTYVRLARMTFSWKYMFFGLKHDDSRDLHAKSYFFYLRNFYK